MSTSRFLLAAALLMPLAPLSAASLGECRVKTDYSVERQDGGYLFSRGHAAEIRIREGRLLVDGADAPLSQADRARLHEFQSQLDNVIEQARGIAMEAASIAMDAVSEVALAFFGDDPAMLQRFEKRLAVLDAEIRKGLVMRDGPLFDESAFERAVETAMKELAPMLARSVAAKAVTAALSGDEDVIRDIEARASRLEREIEAKVTRRARDIEARAEALCPQIESLAATLDALDFRHADGSGLQLIRVRR